MNLMFLTVSLVRGGGRRERLRAALSVLGVAVATFALLCAVLVLDIPLDRTYSSVHLSEHGRHPALAIAFALTALPALGFAGQCARLGAVRRDRRLAALRLAGATGRDVRTMTAAETGLYATAGSLLGLAAFAGVRAVAAAVQSGDAVLALPTDVSTPRLWLHVAAVVLLVPPVVTGVAVLALRTVADAPLELLRGRRPVTSRLAPPVLMAAGLAVVVAAVVLDVDAVYVVLLAGVAVAAAGLLAATGPVSVLTGRLLVRHGRGPVALLAGRRLQADPWAFARAGSAVLLCTTGVAAAETMRWSWMSSGTMENFPGFYHSGFNIVDLGLAVALLVGTGGLLVGAADQTAGQRRTAAAQQAAGVPADVLRKAAFVQTVAPVLPGTFLAAALGGACTAVTGLGDGTWAFLPVVLAVTVGVTLVCAAVTALSLPLLDRRLQPGELRHT